MKRAGPASIPIESQVSAGGVAYRRADGRLEVALISVGQPARWQLPKGLVRKGETHEAAAVREVREETGLQTEPGALLEVVEYWYYGGGREIGRASCRARVVARG